MKEQVNYHPNLRIAFILPLPSSTCLLLLTCSFWFYHQRSSRISIVRNDWLEYVTRKQVISTTYIRFQNRFQLSCHVLLSILDFFLSLSLLRAVRASHMFASSCLLNHHIQWFLFFLHHNYIISTLFIYYHNSILLSFTRHTFISMVSHMCSAP